ncbi:MAG: class I SAM-dependent methyltransferase [Candidatus Wildermuthbacteria bacterium]|nr:class I SAM-dependent methyltransferase [Candidatus Wildermuthbacteria bacterium]
MGFLSPSAVLGQLSLRKDMVAADFGCGSGGWVLPLAKILEDGKVYAIDILEEPLSALRNKAKIEKLFNIETIKSDVENGTRLLNNSCDLVLMTNLLFQSESKRAILEEGKRVLKSGGEVLVVDWKRGASLGPKEGAVEPAEIKELFEEAGFKLKDEFQAGSYHYGLLFEK